MGNRGRLLATSLALRGMQDIRQDTDFFIAPNIRGADERGIMDMRHLLFLKYIPLVVLNAETVIYCLHLFAKCHLAMMLLLIEDILSYALNL